MGKTSSPTKHRRRIDGLREGSFPPASMPRSLQVKPDAMPNGRDVAITDRALREADSAGLGWVPQDAAAAVVGSGQAGDAKEIDVLAIPS